VAGAVVVAPVGASRDWSVQGPGRPRRAARLLQREGPISHRELEPGLPWPGRGM